MRCALKEKETGKREKNKGSKFSINQFLQPIPSLSSRNTTPTETESSSITELEDDINQNPGLPGISTLTETKKMSLHDPGVRPNIITDKVTMSLLEIGPKHVKH